MVEERQPASPLPAHPTTKPPTTSNGRCGGRGGGGVEHELVAVLAEEQTGVGAGEEELQSACLVWLFGFCLVSFVFGGRCGVSVCARVSVLGG